jgi:hypothetical protein
MPGCLNLGTLVGQPGFGAAIALQSVKPRPWIRAKITGKLPHLAIISQAANFVNARGLPRAFHVGGSHCESAMARPAILKDRNLFVVSHGA